MEHRYVRVFTDSINSMMQKVTVLAMKLDQVWSVCFSSIINISKEILLLPLQDSKISAFIY